MDITTLMSAMLSNEGLSGISKATQVPTNDVSNILMQAMPLLLQGVGNQANSEKTSASFVQALTDHAQDDTSDLTKFFGGVDLEDGAKIVKHLLGANASSTVAKASGATKKDAGNVLSAVAPLLMSLLGQQTTGKAAKKNSTTGLVNALLSEVDMSTVAKAALTLAAAGAVKKAVSGNAKKTAAKTAAQAPAQKQQEGIDVADVVNLIGKMMK